MFYFTGETGISYTSKITFLLVYTASTPGGFTDIAIPAKLLRIDKAVGKRRMTGVSIIF